VRGGERARDLLAERADDDRVERLAAQQHVAQARPLDELHHEPDDAVLAPGVVDAHDVGVAEPRGRARLALEALDDRRVAAWCGWSSLTATGTREVLVEGAPHDAAPPDATTSSRR
jgi:hypothetical protein